VPRHAQRDKRRGHKVWSSARQPLSPCFSQEAMPSSFCLSSEGRTSPGGARGCRRGCCEGEQQQRCCRCLGEASHSAGAGGSFVRVFWVLVMRSVGMGGRWPLQSHGRWGGLLSRWRWWRVCVEINGPPRSSVRTSLALTYTLDVL
jgi:hypothetical protein